jgi:predicted alpha/beta-hydrolase family hydrolase
MVSFKTLEIIGYQGELLPHTFLSQQEATDHVAILLPGVGYTVHMPLLYYPMLELVERGADVLRLETMYVKRPDFDRLSPAEKARRVFTDAAAACRAALAQRAYTKVTLVGKSLGTLAMGHLLTTEPALTHAECIWLTPLSWNDTLRSQIHQVKPRSLFVAGTSDPHYHSAFLAEVEAATAGEVVVIEAANHSIEIAGDVMASLQALETVMHAVRRFLSRGQDRPPAV